MSRHRNVRSMRYEDDLDEDDMYGHSVEDDYCVSPGTASQFTYDRNSQQQLASFMSSRGHIEEIPEENESDEEGSLQNSSKFQKPSLGELDQAKLNSCLVEMRSILGDSLPEHVLSDAVVKAGFNYEQALSSILSEQEAPKPQRAERNNRRNRGPRAGSNATEAAVAPEVAKADNVPSATVTAGVKEGPEAEANDTAASQGLARMTFSSSKQKRKGFDVEANGAEATVVDGDSAATAVAGGSRSSAERDAVVMETPTKKELTPLVMPTSLPRSASKTKIDKMDLTREYEKRKEYGKDSINLVVIGHVDAGKSTLMGHVLYQMGFVNKRLMHKYEQESKKMGKASFAYAWVLDETEEERTRGVTMDVAQTRFETESKVVNLLDAPGHKDFIPNMITGAAQADVAVLVVNATRGEFETGFETGGQTREHAMLIRSLGVSQLLVAVNKMDTVDWGQERFQEITKKLGQFLKQAGFRESDVTFIPCSGLNGENLTRPSQVPKLTAWYKGPTVIDRIDQFQPPERPVDKPLRLCVCDIFKGIGAGVSVSGILQAGGVQLGDRVLIMPQGEVANVKAITIDELSAQCAFAGDNITLVLTGIDMTNVGVGSILCAPERPIPSCRRFRARIVVFNTDVPLTKGFPVVLHYQSLSEPARIRKLISQLHKSSGEVVKKNPRCLTKNSNAMVELELDRPICIELYKDFRDLGRFMLRYSGATIAAGLVTEITDRK